jgi:GNAT superfamily N-acetyltransferase
MGSGVVAVERATLTSPVALQLIGDLNAELSALYPEPGATHFRLDPDEVGDGRGAFVVATLDGIPIGCGAVRRLDDSSAELKRMYVAAGGRGRGIGRQILAALEVEARRLGVRQLLLETGIRQHAALALYAGAGFTAIPAFGEYVDTPTSVCLGKSL